MSQAQITDIATVHVDKERDRRARAFARDIRRAKPKESYDGLNYEGQLLFEEMRRRQRIVQECIVDWLMDRDTVGASRVKEAMRRNKLFQQGFRSGAIDSTDPLNLWGKQPTKKELKQAAEAERLASGRRKHVIPDPSNPSLNVMVDTVRGSHLNLVDSKKRGSVDPEDKLRQDAADRFRRDFDLATYHGSKGFTLQDKVDGGGGGSASHTIALEARARISEVKRRVGERAFDLLLVRIGLEASSADIHKAGGQDHQSNNFDFKLALNALVKLYDGVEIIDRTWEAARRLKTAAGMGFLK